MRPPQPSMEREQAPSRPKSVAEPSAEFKPSSPRFQPMQDGKQPIRRKDTDNPRRHIRPGQR